MIPIRDHNPSATAPRVTQALIAVNVLVFLYSRFGLGEVAQIRFLFEWSFIPLRLHVGAAPQTLLTAMFLHGGWLHLGGNMLFLWIFGDNVEARLGRGRYLAFYLICGVLAGLAQYLHDPLSRAPVVGASGAIAAVLGAYLRFYPRARVDVFFFFLIFWRTIPIPAWAVLTFWFALQAWSGLADPAMADGVAYWEHIAGFAAGFLIALAFRRPAPPSGAPPSGTMPQTSPAPGATLSAIPKVPRRR